LTDNKQILISVVLPTCNVESFIGECIDSILCQTVQADEILVIDDCSTDKTVSIVESFQNEKIILVKNDEKRGLIHNLNLGFSMAKGKYIARVDGDDINHKSRFEKQLKVLLDNNEIKACGSWLACFGASEKVIKHLEYHDDIKSQLLLNCSMSLGCVMLEKEAYSDFKFNDLMLHVEDYDFWAQSIFRNKVYNIQEVLYYYRIHEKQVSTKFKRTQLKNDFSIRLILFKKLKYCSTTYSDVFIDKMLNSKKEITKIEVQKYFEWLRELLHLNDSIKCFEVNSFRKVIHALRNNLIYSIFFQGDRGENSRLFRFRIFLLLQASEQFNLVLKKTSKFVMIFFKSSKYKSRNFEL